MQLIFYFPAWLLEAFKALVPQQRDRNNLAIDWVRAYVVACGESDRLFAQSPILLKAIHWIESQPEPDEALLGELQSLLVERASDEVKIEDGVTKTKGGAYIV